MDAASPSSRPAASLPRRIEAGFARVRYRAWQFFRGLRGHVSPAEAREVSTLLSPRELLLFVSMEAADRRHSLDLLHELRRDAERIGRELPSPLVLAALLHDVGKGPLGMWHRVVFVVLNAIDERLARRVEAPDDTGWQRALWRLRHHATLSADSLRDAGTAPRVIEIVAAHTGDPPAMDPEIAWFIAADDRV